MESSHVSGSSAPSVVASSAQVPGSSQQAPGSSVPHVSTSPHVPACTRLQKGVIQPVNYKQVTKFGLACSTGEPHTLDEALGDVRWKNAERTCGAPMFGFGN